MKEYDLFQDIGKETPYKTPAGFFETITEKTLQKAILREKNHRKNNLRRLIFSTAASIALLFYLGFHFMRGSVTDPALNQVVQKTPSAGQQTIKEHLEISKQSTGIAAKKSLREKTNGEKSSIQDKTEVLSDVLSDMTDDELQQMAAIYKTDPFIDESAH